MANIQGTALDLFQETLNARLRKRGGLGGVAVELSIDEISESFPPEAIWWGDSETTNEIPVMSSGTKRVDEQVETELVIQVLLADGGTQGDTNNRAREIFAEVQQELAETPGAIDVPTFVAELVSWRRRKGPLTNKNKIPIGHGCVYECTIRHRARLQPV